MGILTSLAPLQASTLPPPDYTSEPFPKPFRIAMITAPRDLGATRNWVPSRVGPFDCGVLCHRSATERGQQCQDPEWKTILPGQVEEGPYRNHTTDGRRSARGKCHWWDELAPDPRVSPSTNRDRLPLAHHSISIPVPSTGHHRLGKPLTTTLVPQDPLLSDSVGGVT